MGLSRIAKRCAAIVALLSSATTIHAQTLQERNASVFQRIYTAISPRDVGNKKPGMTVLIVPGILIDPWWDTQIPEDRKAITDILDVAVPPKDFCFGFTLDSDVHRSDLGPV